MDPILDKARGGQNQLEQLANAIPGFRGYRERELRRDADRLQREHLAARLEECKKALNEKANAATRSGDLGAINDIETARKRLDKLINRIRYADRGYSGFFDTVKVDENMLGRIYTFDLGLLEAVEGIAQAAGAASVQDLIARIDVVDSSLGQREEVLRGVR
jgi:hypothetical protein